MRELLNYLNSLLPVERERFAERCKTTEGYLRKAISSQQKISEALCVRIASASCGAVTCESLRPDVNWAEFHRWSAPVGQSLPTTSTEQGQAVAVVNSGVRRVA